jgi:hypothetical protein
VVESSVASRVVSAVEKKESISLSALRVATDRRAIVAIDFVT